MKYQEFYDELIKQIGLNSKFFKPKEIMVLMDFKETISKDDFDKE